MGWGLKERLVVQLVEQVPHIQRVRVRVRVRVSVLTATATRTKEQKISKMKQNHTKQKFMFSCVDFDYLQLCHSYVAV